MQSTPKARKSRLELERNARLIFDRWWTINHFPTLLGPVTYSIPDADLVGLWSLPNKALGGRQLVSLPPSRVPAGSERALRCPISCAPRRLSGDYLSWQRLLPVVWQARRRHRRLWCVVIALFQCSRFKIHRTLSITVIIPYGLLYSAELSQDPIKDGKQLPDRPSPSIWGRLGVAVYVSSVLVLLFRRLSLIL
jgi:hypothetical protein